MIEPDPKDVERNTKSLYALKEQAGYRFIESVAESMAYQQALVRFYRTEFENAAKDDREHRKALLETFNEKEKYWHCLKMLADDGGVVIEEETNLRDPDYICLYCGNLVARVGHDYACPIVVIAALRRDG